MFYKKERVLIIDGNNLIYSSFFASQSFKKEIKMGGVFLFLRVLISVIKKFGYGNILVVFDGGGENFRKKLLPSYKSQREKMPENLLEQVKIVKELLTTCKIANMQLDNCEADDVIASFVSQNSKKNPELVFDVFTRDKDLMQLINKNINVLKYKNKKIFLYTEDDFFQEYNFHPTNYLDYLSLLGDKIDNIKGVNGIGKVGAKNLIQQFSSVENIFLALDNKRKLETLSKLLENNKKLVLKNKEIIDLKKDIKLSIDVKKCRFSLGSLKNDKELRKFCWENKFFSVIKLIEC